MKKRSILLAIVFFISIIILSVNSNKKYLVNEEFLATYIDGEKTDSFPAKGTVAFSKAKCDNNTNIEWNNDTWGLYVTNLSNKVKCNIYFKTGENAVTKITSLASSDTTNMASDDPDNNIRYIGANPNNYVYFNCSDYANQTSETCEKWRIIGIFNNIEKEDGTKENLIKIIRNESIGNYSWDSTDSSVNNGWGVNDWSKSHMMKLLNPDYDRVSIGGSLYYNSGKGKCYYGGGLETNDCDFTNNGLKSNITKNSIENVYWNLGASSYEKLSEPVSNWYNYERSDHTASSAPKLWLGKIALLYPSDYGFSTSGGTNINRSKCLENMYVWSNSDMSDCKNNSYLFINQSMLTLTVRYDTSTHAFYIEDNGKIDGFADMRANLSIRPTLFLKSNLLITSGDGSLNTPYQLGI